MGGVWFFQDMVRDTTGGVWLFQYVILSWVAGGVVLKRLLQSVVAVAQVAVLGWFIGHNRCTRTVILIKFNACNQRRCRLALG